MSIRLRLTLWYSLVLAVMLIALGAGIYTTLSNNLRNTIDTQLSDTADRILSASRVRQFSDILQVDVPEELDIFKAPGVAVVVIDNDHQVVRKSRNVGAFNEPFDPDALDLVTPQNSVTHDVTVGGAQVRVFSAPIAVSDQQVGYLQVAATLDDVTESLRQLGVLMLLGGAIGVLAAAIVGAFLARQALQPINGSPKRPPPSRGRVTSIGGCRNPAMPTRSVAWPRRSTSCSIGWTGCSNRSSVLWPIFRMNCAHR